MCPCPMYGRKLLSPMHRIFHPQVIAGRFMTKVCSAPLVELFQMKEFEPVQETDYTVASSYFKP